MKINMNSFKSKMMRIFDSLSSKEDSLENDINHIANSLDEYKTNNFQQLIK